MATLILIVAGVLIGLKVERWRGVFIGAASVGGACMVLLGSTALIQRTESLFDVLSWALFTGVMLFLFSLGIIALTFAIRKANRRQETATPAPSSEPDQFRES
jgi:membrane-bound ClpP family serine protease